MERLYAPWRHAYVTRAPEPGACVFCDAPSTEDGRRLIVHEGRTAFIILNLYPYTYAAGLACGTVVADDIRRQGAPAARRWLDTLRLGGSLPPLELARQAGVDMTSPEPLERAIAFFGDLVDELEGSFA